MTKQKIPFRNQKRKSKVNITNIITSFFNKNIEETFSQKQIIDNLGFKSNSDKQIATNILQSLVEDTFLTISKKGLYKINHNSLCMEGTFERKNNGKNFFIPDDQSESIFIAERNSAHAMNGDKVKIQVFAQQKGKSLEGEVIEILNHKQTRFVGILEVQKQFSFLVTCSKTLANDIFIPIDKLNGGKDGDKALVEIVEWPQKAKNPIGKVIDILGKSGENNTEMNAILAEFELPYKYPESLEEAANKITPDISKEEVARREDFRTTTTFTIDPKDAKDFDDALSIKKLENGHWEIGVHIADVTHYVKEGDEIDKEGESRATSIYLVDRTIPMLPEHLSNGLCSLRPNEEKLCYSVILELDDNAKIIKHRIVETVIESDKRFTYEEAQEILEKGEGLFCTELMILNQLAKKLRDKRFANGAISFERHEVKFEIDENGKPLRVYFKYAKDSNKLIEEFMLTANKLAAEKIGKVKDSQQSKTFIYRIHDKPNEEKFTNLSEFIKRFGYKLKTDGNNIEVSKSINDLLDKVSGRPEEDLVSTLTIRSMAKAIYSTANIGHYGLAFDYYTHFTSPIRRYPDMMVHRLLKKYLAGGASVNNQVYENKCKHSSSMEQLAANAERASIKYKQVEFMSDKLGMVYDAVVSGVTEWGLYAEINENKCEGMIPIRDLDDDFYEFDEKNYCLIGRRNKHLYRLGDKIKIKVARANLERKQLDFALERDTNTKETHQK